MFLIRLLLICIIFVITKIYAQTESTNATADNLFKLEVINSTLHNITLKINVNSAAKELNADSYTIELKLYQNDNWMKLKEVSEINKYTSLSGDRSFFLQATIYSNNTIIATTATIYFTRECFNIPNDIPMLRNVRVVPGSTYADIHWHPVCNRRLFFYLTCVDVEPWCSKNIITEQTDSKRDSYRWYNLQAYTNYTLLVKVQNSTEVHAKLLFRTDPDSPNEVRNLTVYSRDKHVLKIRWMAPYPPKGVLQSYNVIYDMCDANDKSSLIINKPTKCKLWDEFICFEITNVNENHCYAIGVNGKNFGYMYYGVTSTTITNTSQNVSLSPVNLNSSWIDDQLLISWNHPEITNGDLNKFLIVITRLDTSIVKSSVFEYAPLYLHITNAEKDYKFLVQDGIPFSSRYNISVCGINEFLGKNTSIIILTPPATPVLKADVIAREYTDTTQVITIPGINPTTLSHISYLFVLVCDMDAESEERTDSYLTEMIKMDMSTLVKCDGSSWIAIELQANEIGITFTVGDDLIVQSKSLGGQIQNKALNPLNKHMISVVLMNEYNMERRYGVYNLLLPPRQSYWHPGFYALLLFILIPFIAWFVYWYKKKRSENEESCLPFGLCQKAENRSMRTSAILDEFEESQLYDIRRNPFSLSSLTSSSNVASPLLGALTIGRIIAEAITAS